MGRRVLIVDDSVVMRMMIRSCLPPEAGHQVREAANGREALQAYEAERPDIVFMDLTMPVMDGTTAIERIMAQDPKAMIIVVTADVQTRSIQRVMDLGAFMVVKKPPTKERIVEALAMAESRLGGVR